MFKSVLAFGDSHVAGFEIDDATPHIISYYQGKIPFENIDLNNKHKSFPNIVANHFNVPCYNFAMTAGSNARSMRLLPAALLEHPDSLVLFCYTSHHRSEFFYPEEQYLAKDSEGYIQVGTHLYDKDLLYKDFINISKNKNSKINDFYVENILRIDQDTNITAYNTMFFVEQACKNNAANYRHVFLNDSWISINNYAYVNQHKILNFIDKSNAGHGCYYNFCNDKFNQTPYGHFTSVAHQYVAEHIIANLEIYQ
jgi:hypothetical protein